MSNMHYVCWFTRGQAAQPFVPADGGCRHEPDQLAWEMTELLRDHFGVPVAAFIPAFPAMAAIEPARLPAPARCLEVFSSDLLARVAEAEQYDLMDLQHQLRSVQATAVRAWIEEYRQLWTQGYHVVRVPD